MKSFNNLIFFIMQKRFLINALLFLLVASLAYWSCTKDNSTNATETAAQQEESPEMKAKMALMEEAVQAYFIEHGIGSNGGVEERSCTGSARIRFTVQQTPGCSADPNSLITVRDECNNLLEIRNVGTGLVANSASEFGTFEINSCVAQCKSLTFAATGNAPSCFQVVVQRSSSNCPGTSPCGTPRVRTFNINLPIFPPVQVFSYFVQPCNGTACAVEVPKDVQ
jgi:hypothetical protein